MNRPKNAKNPHHFQEQLNNWRENPLHPARRTVAKLQDSSRRRPVPMDEDLKKTTAILLRIRNREKLLIGRFLPPPRKRKVAMVLQSYALYPHMSVYANIAFPLKIARMEPAAIDRRAVPRSRSQTKRRIS